jgi:hypothetical protein
VLTKAAHESSNIVWSDVALFRVLPIADRLFEQPPN